MIGGRDEFLARSVIEMWIDQEVEEQSLTDNRDYNP